MENSFFVQWLSCTAIAMLSFCINLIILMFFLDRLDFMWTLLPKIVICLELAILDYWYMEEYFAAKIG